jgi:hypothetical protein
MECLAPLNQTHMPVTLKTSQWEITERRPWPELGVQLDVALVARPLWAPTPRPGVRPLLFLTPARRRQLSTISMEGERWGVSRRRQRPWRADGGMQVGAGRLGADWKRQYPWWTTNEMCVCGRGGHRQDADQINWHVMGRMREGGADEMRGRRYRHSISRSHSVSNLRRIFTVEDRSTHQATARMEPLCSAPL